MIGIDLLFLYIYNYIIKQAPSVLILLEQASKVQFFRYCPKLFRISENVRIISENVRTFHLSWCFHFLSLKKSRFHQFSDTSFDPMQYLIRFYLRFLWYGFILRFFDAVLFVV